MVSYSRPKLLRQFVSFLLAFVFTCLVAVSSPANERDGVTGVRPKVDDQGGGGIAGGGSGAGSGGGGLGSAKIIGEPTKDLGHPSEPSLRVSVVALGKHWIRFMLSMK
jgi:hypothetical protein